MPMTWLVLRFLASQPTAADCGGFITSEHWCKREAGRRGRSTRARRRSSDGTYAAAGVRLSCRPGGIHFGSPIALSRSCISARSSTTRDSAKRISSARSALHVAKSILFVVANSPKISTIFLL